MAIESSGDALVTCVRSLRKDCLILNSVNGEKTHPNHFDRVIVAQLKDQLKKMLAELPFKLPSQSKISQRLA